MGDPFEYMDPEIRRFVGYCVMVLFGVGFVAGAAAGSLLWWLLR